MKDKKIDILGTTYYITFKNYEDDSAFEKRAIMGYCNLYDKVIVICNMNTYPGYENERDSTLTVLTKECIRHEIVHASLAESGLMSSSLSYGGAWADNEEMIDWIALQMPKIYKVWESAGAI